MLQFMTFLDRFMYKNPKKRREGEAAAGAGGEWAALQGDGSSGAPKRQAGSRVMRDRRGGKHVGGEEPVTAPSFAQQDEGSVRPDEVFFYKFFRTQNERSTRRKPKRPRRQLVEDGDSEDEEAAEEKFAQKLAESLMKDDGGGGGDDDIDDAEFDYSDDDDDVDDDEVDADMGGDSDVRCGWCCSALPPPPRVATLLLPNP